MPEPSPGASELDARLVDIDRRLREIQSDLAADQPSPVPDPPAARRAGEAELPAAPPGAPGSTRAPRSIDWSRDFQGRSAPATEANPRRPPAVAERPPDPPESPDPPGEPLDVSPQPEDPDQLQSGRSGPLTVLLQRTRRRREADSELRGDLAALVDRHDQLLRSLHELIDAHRATVRRLDAVDQPQRRQPEAAASEPGEVTVSAGPFASTAALQQFLTELAALPLVGDVRLRGYEGQDRALVEVQLERGSA